MARDYKIDDKFTYIKVELDAFMGVKKIEQKEMKIIGISEYLICLDGSLFPTLAISKTFRDTHGIPEKVSICEHRSKTMADICGKFNVSIYSQMSIKHIENKINREFKNWLDEKMGMYGLARDIKIKLNVQEKTE